MKENLKDSTHLSINLKNLNEELHEEMDDLKTKCKTLEDNLKYEKKKAKKARKNADKKLAELCNEDVKVEDTDDEQVEIVTAQLNLNWSWCLT